MSANCSGASLLPLSEDYYSAIEPEKLYFLYVDVVLTFLIALLFGEECYFVISTYKHFNITVKSLWLITIYPVFAISALLAVLVPRASYICDFVSSCYLSVCLFQFSSLILMYFGHVDHLLAKVKDTGFSLRTGPCCCCCCCCPTLPPIRKSLITVRLMIFQTAILQPILQFISAVLWADDKYYRFGINFDQSYVYLTTLKVTSTLTALYGLTALQQTTQLHLRTHNTRPKQVALQLVQVFYALQGAILTIPARYQIPPCRNGFSSHFQMLEWHHLILVVEMFLLSLLARIYYRQPLALDAILEAQIGTLADIYTHNHNPPQGQKDAESTPCEDQPAPLTKSTPSKDQPAPLTFPQDNSIEEVSQSNEDSVGNIQSQESSTHNIHSASMEKSTENHSASSNQLKGSLHQVDESGDGDAPGTINPTFDEKSSSGVGTENHCKNATPK